MDNNAIDKIITKHKPERGALISILHDIQREEGYVPDDVMGYLSKTLQLPISEIFRVVSYFNRAFSLKPTFLPSCCTGIAWKRVASAIGLLL